MYENVAGLFFSTPGARPWEEDELKPIPLLLVNIDANVENFVQSTKGWPSIWK